ncbi:MAG TPA: FAD-linked oxidase C-terminal domain-containing protein, partial [Miltoncostaeaceae bacterium]|nr:FAD-linked oxidase C-terminal domain-containing protein [Miltoncostaeaceae bacterium]
ANTSAGARSIAYGLTAGHVRALDVTLADGTRATLRRGAPAPGPLEAARGLAAAARPPALLRRVSGYDLGALAGDEPDWPRLLCGSEGTLAVIRQAEVALVERPAARGLALRSFPSVDAALEAAVAALEGGPSAVELMARSAIDVDAPAQLVIEHSGDPAEVAGRLHAVPGARVVLDPAEQEAVWAVRRAGIGSALREAPPGPGDPRPLAFIEDPAVPPERCPELARGVRRILEREGLQAVWYGHASVGCLHIRPRMDLRLPGAVAAHRRIAEETAVLVCSLGGSLSGEHGDGRARSELLPRMYPPETIAAFGELKRLLDPEGLLNPGVITDPEPLDEGLRVVASPPRRARPTALGFGREGGLARAGEACNGNGACRSRAATMCPSYQALRDERHSTRGRAVILRAALEGRLPAGLADDGLHEALDLCLGCKACATECPARVDMTALKAEALSHRHAARGVPPAARLAGHAHGLLSLGSRSPRLARLGSQVAGRVLGSPPPAPVRRWRPRPATSANHAGERPIGTSAAAPAVALMADTFTRFLEPGIGDAALLVLAACGAAVEVVDPGCCGRPLLSQGLVGPARRRARRAVARLAPHALAGRPIVVLEPSCWSMLVDDLPRLLPGDPRARWVADAAVSFERAVVDLGPPELAAGPEVLVHEHCHAKALGGGAEGAAALAAIPGLATRASGAGCCGMAGAFGHRHRELSLRIAEDRLVPAVRAAAGVAVAAGTSCREQIRRAAGRPAVHPAELLAGRLA